MGAYQTESSPYLYVNVDKLNFTYVEIYIKKDELLLISKGLDYSYFGESRIKVKVN